MDAKTKDKLAVMAALQPLIAEIRQSYEALSEAQTESLALVMEQVHTGKLTVEYYLEIHRDMMKQTGRLSRNMYGLSCVATALVDEVLKALGIVYYEDAAAEQEENV